MMFSLPGSLTDILFDRFMFSAVKLCKLKIIFWTQLDLALIHPFHLRFFTQIIVVQISREYSSRISYDGITTNIVNILQSSGCSGLLISHKSP